MNSETQTNYDNAPILVVVKDQNRADLYRESIEIHGIPFALVPSLQDAISRAGLESHRGVLIDMPLIIRASPSVKCDIEDLMNGLPSATLNINSRQNAVRLLPRCNRTADCTTMEQFFAVCAMFTPKLIFSRKRKPYNFNVLTDSTPHFSRPEKTVTIDISSGGCFLYSAQDDIIIGGDIWIKLPETFCQIPIKGIVCWQRPWGTDRKIPGIGIRFENIPVELARMLEDLI